MACLTLLRVNLINSNFIILRCNNAGLLAHCAKKLGFSSGLCRNATGVLIYPKGKLSWVSNGMEVPLGWLTAKISNHEKQKD